MNIRTRSSRAVSRSSTIPQYAPISGNTYAAIPNAPRDSHVRKPPTGPAAPNQMPSTPRSETTTRKMPSASRACGDRICRTGVFGGCFGFARVRFAGVRAAGFRARVAFEARDDERREGEVFVGTYTSMITGRITGLRWVTSKKYFFSTRRTFCCKTDGSVT